MSPRSSIRPSNRDVAEAVALIAVVLLIIHFVIVPRSVEFHAGKPLGIAAIVLILIGVILSAAPPLKRKIPYHRWLPMHRLMGLFFAVGVAHAFLSELVFIRAYIFVVAIVGVGSWLYRAFFYRLINRPLSCVVDQVQDTSWIARRLVLPAERNGCLEAASALRGVLFPVGRPA
jgi:predicted ferric reductase